MNKKTIRARASRVFPIQASEIKAKRLLITIGALLSMMLWFDTKSTAQILGATPWAVIKCKFSDQPQEPYFNPAFITNSNGMAGYWSDLSYGQISLAGTTIFPSPASNGWYTLPYALNQLTNRTQRIDACKAAATANGVDLSQYYGVIAILNAQIDTGSDGPGRVLLDSAGWFPTTAAHEMGHGYGLSHSYDDNGVVYGDRWDIMSAVGDVYRFPDQFGESGPGLNAPNLEKFGWLPGSRKLSWNGTSQTITLAALNQPETAGYLMVKVPLDFVISQYYTIEFRRRTNWDRAIPRDTVLIHEVRNGLSYIIKTNGGPERLAGEAFDDANYNVTITVLDINNASSTATVNVGRKDAWVDFAHTGFENGNFPTPFNTLAEGADAVAYDRTIHVKAGTTPETATINKPLHIVSYGGPATIGH